jgi:hypothetical protein
MTDKSKLNLIFNSGNPQILNWFGKFLHKSFEIKNTVGFKMA